MKKYVNRTLKITEIRAKFYGEPSDDFFFRDIEYPGERETGNEVFFATVSLMEGDKEKDIEQDYGVKLLEEISSKTLNCHVKMSYREFYKRGDRRYED